MQMVRLIQALEALSLQLARWRRRPSKIRVASHLSA
jgi:hypothetical protein